MTYRDVFTRVRTPASHAARCQQKATEVVRLESVVKRKTPRPIRLLRMDKSHECCNERQELLLTTVCRYQAWRDYGAVKSIIAESEMARADGRCATSTTPNSRQRLRRFFGCIHMTIQTAVLIETLGLPGAPKCAGPRAIFFLHQDHAAAP